MQFTVVQVICTSHNLIVHVFRVLAFDKPLIPASQYGLRIVWCSYCCWTQISGHYPHIYCCSHLVWQVSV